MRPSGRRILRGGSCIHLPQSLSSLTHGDAAVSHETWHSLQECQRSSGCLHPVLQCRHTCVPHIVCRVPHLRLSKRYVSMLIPPLILCYFRLDSRTENVIQGKVVSRPTHSPIIVTVLLTYQFIYQYQAVCFYATVRLSRADMEADGSKYICHCYFTGLLPDEQKLKMPDAIDVGIIIKS